MELVLLHLRIVGKVEHEPRPRPVNFAAVQPLDHLLDLEDGSVELSPRLRPTRPQRLPDRVRDGKLAG